MKLEKTLLAICLLFFTASTQADIFSPSHSCRKPYKPYKFNNEWEVQNFKNGVEAYRRCIEDFVDEQSSAARKHQDAADGAIEEWNRFVRFEIK